MDAALLHDAPRSHGLKREGQVSGKRRQFSAHAQLLVADSLTYSAPPRGDVGVLTISAGLAVFAECVEIVTLRIRHARIHVHVRPPPGIGGHHLLQVWALPVAWRIAAERHGSECVQTLFARWVAVVVASLCIPCEREKFDLDALRTM